jgi:hypothetical protein
MEFFGKDSNEIDRNNIEFVYVTFEPYIPTKYEEGIWNPNYLGTFNWGAKGVGFGQVAMYRMSENEPGNGRFYFDTEHMSKNFLKQMFAYFVEQSITDRENPDNLKPEFDRQFKPLEEQDITSVG